MISPCRQLFQKTSGDRNQVSLHDCRQSSAILRISHDPSSQQLDVVRPCLVVSTPSTADFIQMDKRLVADGQHKSVQCYEMKGIQCKLARTALGWGVRELAKAARVSQQTISRLEKDEELRDSTLKRIQNALEEAGIEFIPENGGGVGVRFRNPT
jgi:DNA-binding XRE family transcriptional regulator